MALEPTIGTTTSTGATSTSSSRSTLATNFDTFLTLLTTQLKNQNPLEPLDANEFTQQLVQFAGVEQQLQTNDTLTALLNASQTSQAGTALGLVGQTVTADGNTALLDGNQAKWSLNSPKDGVTAKIEIRNAAGSLVYTGDKVPLAFGDQSFAWDGKMTNGARAPEGLYTIRVTGTDVAGNLATIKSEVSGKVDGVDLSTGEAVMLIGDIRVPLAALKSVRTTPVSATGP